MNSSTQLNVATGQAHRPDQVEESAAAALFSYKSHYFQTTTWRKEEYHPVVLMKVTNIHKGKRVSLNMKCLRWLLENGWNPPPNRSDFMEQMTFYLSRPTALFYMRLESKTFEILTRAPRGTYVHPRLLEKILVSHRGAISSAAFDI